MNLIRYKVGPLYVSSPDSFVTSSLEEATRHAAAFAMHSGQTFSVEANDQTIFTVSPSNIDWRRVNAEHMLAVKAMAHDLVPGVEQITPETKKEGFRE